MTGVSAAGGQRDLAYDLSAYVAGAKFADLGEDTVQTTKLSIIDTIGVTLASTGLTPGVDAYVNVAAARGGPAESTAIGFPHRLAAPTAAWLNGALVHGLDYDDLVRDCGYHPSTPTVPTALALAERSPGISGKDFLLAVAIGNDLGTRIAASVPDPQGWFGTPVFGSFAAAATASKLLGLDENAVHKAFGLAFVRSAGTLEMRWSANSGIASFNGAAPNENGVMAGLLAAAGADGIENVFEGRGGFFSVYFDNKYEREVILDRLGSYFRGSEVSFKVWPACGGSHCAIDATLNLFADNQIDPGSVTELTVATTLGTFALCQPIEVRRRPQTSMDAKFSIPYAVSVAAVRGDVTLDDFLPQNLGREDVLAFAQKVNAVDDPSLAIRKAALPARISVTTSDGKTYEHRTDQPKGVWPYSRLTADEVVAKFIVNASYARNPVSEAAGKSFVDSILGLEDLDDTSTLLEVLTP
jgi:2-methylcitrate dehydratase PrpD